MTICTRTQGFYENVANAYSSLGLKGHGGIDINCGYGSPIECPLAGYVYSVYDNIHKAKDGYWAIFLIAEYKGQLGELCIGHCAKILLDIGQNVTKGQVIAQEGNHGYVFENGVPITLAMQADGDERGHHRHWQWRPVAKTKTLNNEQFLIDFSGYVYRDKEGFYYKVLDYNNGFHGLSPEIAGILNDYDDWFLGKSLPPAIDNQQSFIEILKKYLNLLRGIKK